MCKDEKGITHVGNTPPAACANVVLYVVSRVGDRPAQDRPHHHGEQLRVEA